MNRFLLILAGMLAVPWNLSAAPRKNQNTAEIVVNGQPSAVILLSERPTRSAQFAALELQYHIEKMTGVKLPLERGKTSHPGTRIRVGGAGSGKKPFEFQEYEIQADGKDILLTGCDDEDFTEVDYRKSSTFPGIWKKIGTVYAVYDFLERLGFRWYLPTDLGIAFERKTSLKAPVLSIRRKPTMEMRNMFPMYNAIPADLCGDTIDEMAKDARLNPRDTSLWYLRRRMGGRWVIINHSMYTFYPRFLKKHPDWFAKGYGSGRAGQLCYTNPEVIRQVVKDARNYFDGRLKAASQVLSNVPADYRSDVFPVFPMDNRSFCRCPVRPVAETLVVIDPENLLLVNDLNERAGTFHTYPIQALGAAGLPYETCSFRDLGKIDLGRFRFIVLCHPFFLPEPKMALLREKVLNSGRTVLWVYGCAIDSSGRWDPANVEKTCGIAYGTPGVGRKDMVGWKSAYVFRTEDTITSEVMRDLAKSAGCHLWTSRACPVYANSRFVCVHAVGREPLTVLLPEKAARATELYTGKTWENTDRIEVTPDGVSTWLWKLEK